MKTKKGAAIAEFILILPTFLVLSLLVIELALFSVDKHILNLAAFEAARIYSMSDLDNPCADKELEDIAKVKAVLKIALIAPSASYFLSAIKIKINDDIIKTNTTSAANMIFKMFQYVLMRIPSAYALTSIKCNYDRQSKSVNIDLTYLRTPKAPFVKNIFWTIYALSLIKNKIPNRYISNQIILDDYYQARLSNFKLTPEGIAKLKEIENNIKSLIKDSIKLNLNIDQISEMLEQMPYIDKILVPFPTTANNGMLTYTQIFLDLALNIKESQRSITPNANNVVDELRKRKDELITKIQNTTIITDQTIQQIQKGLNAASTVINAAVYAMPEQLRFIPQKAKARVAKIQFENSNSTNWEGTVRFLTKFSDNGSENWKQWAEKFKNTTEETIKYLK